MKFWTVPNFLRQRPLLADILLLSLLIGLFFSVTLGLRAYGTPSEARYIEIPRQMVATGDWLTPRLNGVKYFEKPPLFYWLQASQFTLFGRGEFSGRFWTMALMLALCLVTYVAAASLYSRNAGRLAALTLATSVLGFGLSRIVLLDVPVSFFLTSCLFAFIFAVRSPPGEQRERLLLAMYVCAACTVLTKGLIGIVLPGLVIGMWIVLTGNWHLLRQLRLVSGTILFLVITVPWHLMTGNVTPEFFHFYFIHEHFERFLTKIHHRYQPWWFFFAVVTAGWLPWLFFLPRAKLEALRGMWSNRKVDGTQLFFALWVGLLFLFFSSSHSKLIPYILPIFPPMALWLGQYFAQGWREGEVKSFYPSVFLMVLLMLGVVVASPFIWPLALRKDSALTALQPYVITYAGLLMLTALTLAHALLRKAHASFIITALLLYAAAQALLLDTGISSYARDSVKPFAEYLDTQLKPGDEVAAYHHYYQDLPVYLNRNITVVEARGELEFGVSIEPRTRQWMIDDAEFWKRWQQPGHRMYMITTHNLLESLPPPPGMIFTFLQDNGKHLLFSNQPPVQ